MAIETLRPTVQTNSFATHAWTAIQNPLNAYDTSESTAGTWEKSDSLVKQPWAVFSGWPTAGQTYTALALKIKLSFSPDPNPATSGGLYLQYSTNGSTFVNISGWEGILDYVAQTTITINLSAGQDLTLLMFRCSLDASTSTDDFLVDIYDVRTEGTYTAAAPGRKSTVASSGC